MSSIDDTIQQTPKPMDLQRLYRYLQLESFSESEIDSVFERICKSNESNIHGHISSLEEDLKSATTTTTEDTTSDESSDIITVDHIQCFLQERLEELEQENALESKYSNEETQVHRTRYAQTEAMALLQSLDSTSFTQDSFRETIIQKASSADYTKTLPIAVSMMLVGSSVGIIIPVMPFVVEQLGLTPGQYGTVVSAFALSRIVGNVPSAILVERHGRKPYMVYSLLGK